MTNIGTQIPSKQIYGLQLIRKDCERIYPYFVVNYSTRKNWEIGKSENLISKGLKAQNTKNIGTRVLSRQMDYK